MQNKHRGGMGVFAASGLLLLLGLVPARGALAQTYTVTDLTVSGYDSSFVTAFNNKGQAVVQSLASGRHLITTLYTPGKGMIALTPDDNGFRSLAIINEHGTVAGTYTGKMRATSFVYTAANGPRSLNLPGFRSSETVGLNARDQVVCTSEDAQGRSTATLYTPGVGIVTLRSTDTEQTVARGINDAGDVAGMAQASKGDLRAFLYRPGQGYLDLTLPGLPRSEAIHINARDAVIGRSFEQNGWNHATLYIPGRGCTDISPRQAFPTDRKKHGGVIACPEFLNDAGQVAAFYLDAKGLRHPYFYSASSGLVTLLLPGGKYGFNRAMNIWGQVAGECDDSAGHSFPTLYTPGRGLMSLAPSSARGNATLLNDAGDVAGSYTSHVGPNIHPFFYSARSGLIDILPSGCSLGDVQAINARGQVVGHAFDKGGRSVATLYTPGVGAVDLNKVVRLPSGITLNDAVRINDRGDIIATAMFPGLSGTVHSYLLRKRNP